MGRFFELLRQFLSADDIEHPERGDVLIRFDCSYPDEPSFWMPAIGVATSRARSRRQCGVPLTFDVYGPILTSYIERRWEHRCRHGRWTCCRGRSIS
jgi:hypothetical protein